MFFFSKSTSDEFDTYKLECLTLLQELEKGFASSTSPSHKIALGYIQQSMKEVKTSKNQMTLFLPFKWLERELGAMIYDKKLQLTDKEEQAWKSLKNLASSYHAGHGTALGL